MTAMTNKEFVIFYRDTTDPVLREAIERLEVADEFIEECKEENLDEISAAEYFIALHSSPG